MHSTDVWFIGTKSSYANVKNLLSDCDWDLPSRFGIIAWNALAATEMLSICGQYS